MGKFCRLNLTEKTQGIVKACDLQRNQTNAMPINGLEKTAPPGEFQVEISLTYSNNYYFSIHRLFCGIIGRISPGDHQARSGEQVNFNFQFNFSNIYATDRNTKYFV